MEINMMLKDSKKSIEIGNQLLEQFPKSKWAPQTLLTLGSFVYNDQLKDTAQAHVMFQRLIDEYPESDLVEIVEIPGLKWYIGTQYHPEYQSTVLKPHPLFVDFVKTAIENRKK
jgi:hypothetical protein